MTLFTVVSTPEGPLGTFPTPAEAVQTALDASGPSVRVAVVTGLPPTSGLEALARGFLDHVPDGEVWVGPVTQALMGDTFGHELAGAFDIAGLQRHAYRLELPEPTQEGLVVRLLSGFVILELPLQDVVAAYGLQLLDGGTWNAGHPSPRALVEVDAHDVVVTSGAEGLIVGGRPLAATEQLALPPGGAMAIDGQTWRHEAIDSDGIRGMLIGHAALAQVPLTPDQPVELGRAPDGLGLAVPDRRKPMIQWCETSAALRAREGGLTLDRAVAGKRMARLDLGADGQATVTALHPRLPTYRLRDDELVAVEGSLDVQAGDRLLIGLSVVELVG